jgi:hypothetical protein
MPLYEDWCSKCNKTAEYYSPVITEITRPCQCGATTERIYSTYKPILFQEYVTRNLRPDGQPVTVHSAKEESALCKEYGVIKADSKRHGGY